MIETIVIPEERKAVLIGTKGSVKKRLEKKTNTKIKIADYVEIAGESLDVLKAAGIVKAIGYGFSPEKAFLLLKEEYQLVIIEFREHDTETRKRIIARVIGKEGLAKKNIEEKTRALISVYGKTISIIAKADHIHDAERAIESLIAGKSHGYAYKIAEHSRK